MMDLNQPLFVVNQNKWRNLGQLSTKEKIFLTLTLITILDEATLSNVKFAIDNSWSSDVIISLVLLINVAFCTVYVVEGVFTTRASQLLALSCTLIFITLLLLGNYITGHHDSIKLAQLILAAVGTITLLVPGLYYANQYHENKRLIILTVGDSETYQTLCTYLLLSRDLHLMQVQTGASTILMTALYYRNTGDIVLLILGFVYLVVSFIGYYRLEKEQLVLSRIFIAVYFLGLGLVIKALIFAGQNLDNIPGIAFAAILSSIAYFTSIIGTVTCAVKLSQRFGSGMTARLQ